MSRGSQYQQRSGYQSSSRRAGAHAAGHDQGEPKPEPQQEPKSEPQPEAETTVQGQRFTSRPTVIQRASVSPVSEGGSGSDYDADAGYGDLVRTRVARVQESESGSKRRGFSEPRRVEVAARLSGTYQYEEPLKLVRLGTGLNCTVPVLVGGRRFKVTIDSGGSRSLIRTSFAQQITKGSHKHAVKRREEISPPLHCQGVCADMKSADMTKAITLGLVFQSVNPDGGATSTAPEVEVTFAELEGAADALLIAFPEMVRWGVHFYDDADGNIWVDFKRLGIVTIADDKMPNE